MSWSVMSDVPNPLFDVNGDPYSGAVLKAYLPGGTTSTSIAIDSAGTSPQTSITYNAEGKLEVSGNEILPFIDRKCKWGIFANSTDATANTPFYQGPYNNVPIASSNTATKNFATMALLVADTGLVDGDVVSIAERTTGNGGASTWDVVLSSTVTENTYNIVQCTGVATLSLVYRYSDTLDVAALGITQGAIVHAETLITADQTMVIPQASIALTGDYALNFQTDAVTYVFMGTNFSYGTEVNRAITFGDGSVAGSTTYFDITVEGRLSLVRTYSNDASTASATALQGTGIRFRNLGDFDSTNLFATVVGFGNGVVIDSQDAGMTTSQFGKMLVQNCQVDYRFNVGSGSGDICSAIDCYGFKNTFNQAHFSDFVGSIGVQFDGTTRRADGIHLYGGALEASNERKFVFDNADNCSVEETYIDDGGYGGFSGVEFKKATITGASVTAGSATITAAAHGITTKTGDKVRVTVAGSALDQRDYIVVAGSTTGTIVVDTQFSTTSAGAVDFTYYGAQLEFTSNSIRCSYKGNSAIEENVITDAGDGNRISGDEIGYQFGLSSPRSFDPDDVTIAGGLSYLRGALASTNIFTYSENAAPQATAGIGHQYRGGSSLGYDFPMCGVLAQPSAKNADGSTASLDIFTSQVGDYHKTFSISGSGILSTFGGATGTENGEHKVETYEASALADDGTYSLTDATYGEVRVTCNAEAGTWLVQSDGTVTLLDGTTNTAATDSDTDLCVYQSGTTAVVKNRLGTTGEIVVTYNHGKA